ncbi:MAG: DnaJ domain-containing protein [Arachidicoccus sp.]|nr:DnaJ domain-containing protein [Arachidicoccus sp.]
MQTKNYYQILGVPLQASTVEIKTAYRKLALQYHPDKNGNDLLSEETFREINEAYTILSDKNKRAAYNHEHFAGIKKDEIVITPDYIFQSIHSIRKKNEYADPYRMNRDALLSQLQKLYAAYNLSVLQKESNLPVNNAIIDETLTVLKFLPITDQQNIIRQFEYFPHNRQGKIINYFKRQKNIFFWEKYKFAFVLLITIIVCAVIYFIIR